MERFSQIYLERGKPTEDSPRMRRRLYKLFSELCPYDDRSIVNDIIHRELGHNIKRFSATTYYPFDEFYENCELRDLLDMPTMIMAYIRFVSEKRRYTDQRKIEKLINETNRIFREENVFYQVDNNAIAHFSPDEEFENSRISTLRSLNKPRYKTAVNHFDQAYKNMLAQKYDYAIRDIFFAAESLAKLMTSHDKLNKKLCQDLLKKEANKMFGHNDHSKKMIGAVMDGYAEQIAGYHEFRHAQETDNNAPIELAILAISNFSSLIRFLVDIDQQPESIS